MLFDLLCKVAEKNPEEELISAAVRNANLFILHDDYVESDLCKIDVDSEWVDWAENTFSLPFQVVAFEGPNALVVFIDKTVGTIGIREERIFIYFTKYDMNTLDPSDNPPLKDFTKEQMVSYYEDNTLVNMAIGVTKETNYDLAEAQLSSVVYVALAYTSTTKDGLNLSAIPEEHVPPHLRDSIHNVVMTYFHSLVQCSEPKNFILETHPKKIKDPSKSKKIPRSHQRPQYTLLEPNKIRKIMGLDSPGVPTGKTVRPHERRAHTRILRSERYGDNRGKRINIKATWVGPSEAIVGNKIYKVWLTL